MSSSNSGIPQGGLPLGALQPIHDPRSVKFSLRNLNLTKVPIQETLLPDNCLVPIAVQTEGSCAAVSATVGAAMADRIASNGGQPRYTNANWLYWWGRVKGKLINPDDQSTWKDTGSFQDVNLSILQDGAPFSDSPNETVGDPRWRPSADLENGPKIDEVLSYAPFYPASEGVEALCTAIANKLVVIHSMVWCQEFSNPPNGILPIITNPAQGIGGHGVVDRGVIQLHGVGTPYVVAINQWDKTWNVAVTQLDNRLRPGEFLIPLEVFASSMVWICEAITYQPIFVPEPTPTPTPDRYDERTLSAMDQISIDTQAELGAMIDNAPTVRAKSIAASKLSGAQYLADKLGEGLRMGRN